MISRDDTAMERIRERIRKNFPKERAPLRWRKVAERLMRSHCGRFQVEKRGEGDGTRYFAFILPTTVIGHRIATYEQAKAICEQHASPLPLEPALPVIEREPGCDDDLGEVLA